MNQKASDSRVGPHGHGDAIPFIHLSHSLRTPLNVWNHHWCLMVYWLSLRKATVVAEMSLIYRYILWLFLVLVVNCYVFSQPMSLFKKWFVMSWSEHEHSAWSLALSTSFILSHTAVSWVSSRFTESHFAKSCFAECRVSFSFHHFHFKFLSLMRYNLFVGVNEMRLKILPLLCRLGLVLPLGSV